MRLAVYYILFLIGYIIFGIVMLVGLHLLISSFPVGSAQAENIGLANANILFRRTLDFNIFISVFSKNYIVSLIYGLKLFILNTCVSVFTTYSVSVVKHQFNPLILNVLSEALKNYTRDYFHSIEGYFLKFLHSIISLQTGIIYNYALFMFVGAILFIGLSFFLVYSPTAAVSFFKVVILLGTIFIVSKNINKKI
jgi:hypothetical protein